jgi:hypothetical protein
MITIALWIAAAGECRYRSKASERPWWSLASRDFQSGTRGRPTGQQTLWGADAKKMSLLWGLKPQVLLRATSKIRGLYAR